MRVNCPDCGTPHAPVANIPLCQPCWNRRMAAATAGTIPTPNAA